MDEQREIKTYQHLYISEQLDLHYVKVVECENSEEKLK